MQKQQLNFIKWGGEPLITSRGQVLEYLCCGNSGLFISFFYKSIMSIMHMQHLKIFCFSCLSSIQICVFSSCCQSYYRSGLRAGPAVITVKSAERLHTRRHTFHTISIVMCCQNLSEYAGLLGGHVPTTLHTKPHAVEKYDYRQHLLSSR